VLDSLFGTPFFLYGAHYEDRLRGAPGQPIAQPAGRKIGALAEQGAGKSDGGLLIEHAGQLGEGRGCITRLRSSNCLILSAVEADRGDQESPTPSIKSSTS
jgi:hypothetical protein